uniref:MADS-box domain-containing protein n=1 Tax=Kalanchoe fedtschenkoi TaxID=63787 RepID=A0A7N0ZYI9_KALFE
MQKQARMGTGRKRIQIQAIQDMSRRRVTLTKRRQGLFKKMEKLRTLTGCKAAAIVFSTAGRPYTFGDLSLFDSFTCAGQGDGVSTTSFDCNVSEDLDGLNSEMTSLLEMRRKVIQKLNQQQVDGGFDGNVLPPQPLGF